MKWLKTAGLLLPAMLILPVLAMALMAPFPAQAQSGQQVNITLKEFMLTPSMVTVNQGQPVQFTIMNMGTIEHNFKLELPSQHIEKTLFDTNLKPGESRTAEFTFTAAGDWEMYCPVDAHEAHGMKGSVQVMGSVPAGMPSTGEPMSAGLWLVAVLGLALISAGLLARRVFMRSGRVGTSG
jgi:uncharacterized cupredoxin-like copper-binding protein